MMKKLKRKPGKYGAQVSKQNALLKNFISDNLTYFE